MHHLLIKRALLLDVILQIDAMSEKGSTFCVTTNSGDVLGKVRFNRLLHAYLFARFDMSMVHWTIFHANIVAKPVLLFCIVNNVFLFALYDMN